ncbi:MAG TPA: MnmC family methyltransferase [Verrucomicrobiota bacterium]|nr:MnmC family methyltransferase [Verrucomicrobiota bacterium]
MSRELTIVKLSSGSFAIRSQAYAETMHPGLGPVAEAESLYVSQLNLRQRIAAHTGEFVVWDVGLGAAANALTLLRLTHDSRCPLRLISFDNTSAPLDFAIQHASELVYPQGHESHLKELSARHHLTFDTGSRRVDWKLVLADFPSFVTMPEAAAMTKPHAILYDAFSPARNPAMWTQSVFNNLFGLLDSSRPCSLTTYSRSTLVRVSMLLAGFFVGRGRPTGLKEETTVAANDLLLLDEPLDARWLERAAKSTSAEPLTHDEYRRAPLSPFNLNALRRHPQFRRVHI